MNVLVAGWLGAVQRPDHPHAAQAGHHLQPQGIHGGHTPEPGPHSNLQIVAILFFLYAIFVYLTIHQNLRNNTDSF